ncbi:hypothetical protein BT63DRAFT_426768 [Microthyrium microscopicum]|uniref:VPS9 domain-containing protein n=1 Tax=Microthyrium microscopicum TaxID=703497 RepID=A0A6A6U6P5_9PEZI|nr:hypothetical protein BT63DRAFT_426768 [Microthyrium microscopicum]
MLPLNPYLRAFFRSSTLPSQCSPVSQHVLLVPTTEYLFTHRDRDTQVAYSDLANSEDFLASHVLRVSGPSPSSGGKEGTPSLRETRGKAKQYTTLNGRTVILKDSFIYSNKGFKHLSQAQVLSDAIFIPDTPEQQPWVIYYISRPLVGFAEPITYKAGQVNTVALADALKSPTSPAGPATPKKIIKSFTDLMNQFPMISRQMQPGLERIFNEFKREIEKPLPSLPSSGSTGSESSRKLAKRRNSISSITSLSNSTHSAVTSELNGAIYHSSLELSHMEEDLRHSLEIAITAAIDLFQMVDKQQLSLLGSSTDLTGAMVERMIERYVTEHLHDTMLFPRICTSRKSEDSELEARVRQMVDIDISQVGISIETGRAGKRELALRLASGVNIFKNMGVSSSPQEMLDILVETEKAITHQTSPKKQTNGDTESGSEKKYAIMAISADTLVSLLLVVVIRSPVRHLQARLLYMRHFIFIDDVESGEIGYALSTFEAVLSYLSHDSSGLRRSSLRNRRLWRATKDGKIPDMREILEPDVSSDANEFAVSSNPSTTDLKSMAGTTLDDNAFAPIHSMAAKTNGSLNHVFPFQNHTIVPDIEEPLPLEPRPKIKKRVSVQSRSASISSVSSVRSIPLTINSISSNFDGDLSMETLAQTQGPDGESVLMMAIHSRQAKALKYLLNLHTYFPINAVLDDENNESTTLLGAAMQTGHRQITDMILSFIIDNTDDMDVLKTYLARQDDNGRCAAHFLFDYPGLMAKIGDYVSWRLKDKNGQTPLFALCRSYDHEEYKWMVETAIEFATKSQRDGDRLRLSDHIDNKGNTLLHIINEPSLAARLLLECDSDVNAANDKHFTPLMVASKYGRTEMVRTLFSDPRVDLYARDLRGLTAVELAKDDEVRNRIDDLVLLGTPPTFDQRITRVVRSYFVEDGTVRFIIKSAAKNPNSTVTITTCRRTLIDFEDLARWLGLELPASWLPKPTGFLSAFLLPSRPSRAVARDTQLRLDSFLRILLSHSTFSTHEMVWEFFLVPDMDPTILAERSKTKADLRTEMVRDDYEPSTDLREVELFVAYARDSVRALLSASKSVSRTLNALRTAQSDLADAVSLAGTHFLALPMLAPPHAGAIKAMAATLRLPDFAPATALAYDFAAITSTIAALLAALSRPTDLIARISAAQRATDRAAQSVRRVHERAWPLHIGLLDDARARAKAEATSKRDRAAEAVDGLGKELRYTQTVVAGEMAGWQEERVKMGREAVKNLARRMLVVERARLEGLLRAGRSVGVIFGRDGRRVKEDSEP